MGTIVKEGKGRQGKARQGKDGVGQAAHGRACGRSSLSVGAAWVAFVGDDVKLKGRGLLALALVWHWAFQCAGRSWSTHDCGRISGMVHGLAACHPGKAGGGGFRRKPRKIGL